MLFIMDCPNVIIHGNIINLGKLRSTEFCLGLFYFIQKYETSVEISAVQEIDFIFHLDYSDYSDIQIVVLHIGITNWKHELE
jgi:hypothetical protein